MGERPSPLHSIDRIDSDGPYSPGNCRWVSGNAQNRNRRSNHTIKFHGERASLVEWSERLGIPYGTLKSRIRRGMNVEVALGGAA
jgi:hypothetical protein